MKNKFITSTIILIIGGFITKLLGMLIKIVMSRLMGTEGIGIYMLISPTFMLFIALAQFGFPIAVSKLVSEEKHNNKNIVFSILPISIILNIVIIFVLLLAAPFIATTLLHEERCYYALVCIGFVLPFISISSILRGYFFGKQKMIPHVISNITEDIIRFLLLIIGIPIFLTRGLEYAVAFLVLSNLISELSSILVLFFFLPKNFKLTKQDFIPQVNNMKNILSISLPSTGSRLIGSIGYFLEPIILTFVLTQVGYSNHFIVTQYGILNGYVMPLLLMPSFFTAAISQALLPIISNSYANNQKQYCRKKLRQGIGFSLLIGIPSTILFLLFPSFLLSFVYHTTEGIVYLKVMAPLFLLHYIQAPLTSSLQAMGKAKVAMQSTLQGMLLKLSLLFGLSLCKIGLWGLIISDLANVLYVTIRQGKYVKICFKSSR